MSVKIIKAGASGVSFGGKEFKADKDGWISVPEEAVAELQSHGFSTTEPPPEPPPGPTVDVLLEQLDATHAENVELGEELSRAKARIADLEAQLADAKAKKK